MHAVPGAGRGTAVTGAAAPTVRTGSLRRLDLAGLAAAYRDGLSPVDVVAEIAREIDRRGDDGVWIARVGAETLAARAEAIAAARDAGVDLPLYGIPFATKDNIDAAGLPTTAGCPDFAYTPSENATVVERLEAAGAILIGKTNLDQFATGLVGVRSPYGVAVNPFDPDCVPGGSSSGSAVAVASGLVTFALGTDTAGSGRVPAGFNNIVGLKPSKGLISTTGLVPACRSLDCISIFALTVADAADILAVAAAPDAADAFSRAAPAPAGPARFDPAEFRVGVPQAEQLEFFGDSAAALLFDQAVDRARALGCSVVEIDYTPFREAAALLYGGPWVAERYAAVGDFIEAHRGSALPVIEEIVLGGARPSAREAFEASYRLAAFAKQAGTTFAAVDALLLPTSPTIYRVAEVEADPIALNTNLGFYTNFMNLLDMAGLAVPAGLRPDGLPFGVTLAAPAFAEPLLCALGAALHAGAGLPMGATGHALPSADLPASVSDAAPAILETADEITLALFGAHMRGQPLNPALVRLGARFVATGRTASSYRMIALPGGRVERPGVIKVVDAGAEIELELWALPRAAVGDLLASIEPPLGLGSVELADRRIVKGFICEGHALTGAEDITGFGGWRAYLAAGQSDAAEA